jgi:hypothetical protein
MLKSHWMRAATMAVALVVAVSGPTPATAGTEDRPVADPFSVGDRPAAAQGFARFVGELGLGDYADVFAGLVVDPKADRLTLFGTDTARLSTLVADARKRAPEALRSVPVDLQSSRYTRQHLEKVRSGLWREAAGWKSLGVQTYTISVRSDGSGLDVTSNQPARYRALVGGLTSLGVPRADVAVRSGPRITVTSRQDDYAPYWGGAPLLGQGDTQFRCSSAFGMRSNSTGFEYLVTAEHCFEQYEDIRDGGGDFIGEAWIENETYDAIGIRTDAGGGVFVDNDSRAFIYGRAVYSWNGEVVCQSGFRSNRICTIRVVNDNTTWEDDSGKIRHGVLGQQCTGCIAVRHGDSGGPVWATGWDGIGESRGIASAGGGAVGDPNGSGGYEIIAWTETIPVLGFLGSSLITGAS